MKQETATDYASVVLSPQSWGTYYTSVSFVGDFDLDSNGSTETSRFTLGTVQALTLTFLQVQMLGVFERYNFNFSVSTITTNITGGVTNNYDSTITGLYRIYSEFNFLQVRMMFQVQQILGMEILHLLVGFYFYRYCECRFNGCKYYWNYKI